MSLRNLALVAFLGVAVAALATLNMNCQVLQSLVDGGTPTDGGVQPGLDGGGGDDGGAAGTDGGGGAGSIQATVTCGTGSPACGKMGAVVAKVRPGPTCGSGAAPIASEKLAGQTLTDGQSIMITVNNVPAGTQCLKIYLDVNGNDTQDAGDAISAAGEISVEVTAGAQATAAVTLDQVMM